MLSYKRLKQVLNFAYVYIYKTLNTIIRKQKTTTTKIPPNQSPPQKKKTPHPPKPPQEKKKTKKKQTKNKTKQNPSPPTRTKCLHRHSIDSTIKHSLAQGRESIPDRQCIGLALIPNGYLAKFRFCQMKRGGNALFINTLNTFYSYMGFDIIMANKLLDSDRENPLPPDWLLYPISSKGSVICTIPQTV